MIIAMVDDNIAMVDDGHASVDVEDVGDDVTENLNIVSRVVGRTEYHIVDDGDAISNKTSLEYDVVDVVRAETNKGINNGRTPMSIDHKPVEMIDDPTDPIDDRTDDVDEAMEDNVDEAKDVVDDTTERPKRKVAIVNLYTA